MRLSIDVETECAVGCTEACEHAVDVFRNRITVVGVAWLDKDNFPNTRVFRDLSQFQEFIDDPKWVFTGFNFKFDYHTLINNGVKLTLNRWQDDASLMAAVYTHKVDPLYIEQYEARRKELNADLPHGKGHRRTSGGSLKILAPYFLGVEPFWEATTSHDNDEYVTKDALYTLQLTEYLEAKLREEGSIGFYKDKFMPWVKMLLQMEHRGISLDLDLMAELEERAGVKAAMAKEALDDMWAKAYKTYREEKLLEINREYNEMHAKALDKMKEPTEAKKIKLQERYAKLCGKAMREVPQAMNIDSPTQMKWLLKEYLKLDVTDFDGDESTGKPVLKRLANEGRADIKALLEYRENRKLVTAFFPSYKDMSYKGDIHCSFNPNIARTGRLSSSGPNLQQVPRHLHGLFRARPGYKLIVKDQAAIEPRLIAYASEDPLLFTILDLGADFHGYNTKIFFDLDCPVKDIKERYPLQREVGKEVGLAILYGAGAIRLQESAQKRGFIWTQDECRDKVRKFREEYQDVGTYQRSLNKQLEQGPITNLFGRPFRVEDPNDIHMKGFNTLIQGSASDLVMNSAWRAQEEYIKNDIDAHVLLLVHDEIVIEVAQDKVDIAEKILDHCMTDYQLETKHGVIKLKVEGKVGDRWEK